MTCTKCNNGYLGRGDIECVNGVLIDIDVAHEGFQPDMAYPPGPCNACAVCHGAGWNDDGDCETCNGTGWKSGREEGQERLNAWRNAP